jgi:4,5:9,10-diseco-3-hydroxy-5,9,17-trioxoandrosta-1(10),2-diene-4-oate hydrolase
MIVQIPDDKYIKIGEINTRYWCLGDRGSTLILIHGFGASVEIWQHNIWALSQQHRVYALDLVGFGRTDKPPGPYDPPVFIRFMDDFMNALDIRSASLVGLSLGGGIALKYAVDFPNKVEKLVLVDSAGLGPKVILSLRLMSLPFVGELMTRPSRKQAYLFFKPAVYDSAPLKGAFSDLYFELFSMPGAQSALLRVLRSMCNIFGAKKESLKLIGPELDKVTAQTLIVWGRQDAVIPIDYAYLAKSKLPNSQLRIFEQCGHMPNFEKPDEFNESVLEFLSPKHERNP